MKKIFITIFFIFFFSNYEGVPSKAATIDLGKIIKIETATKGQKLKEFFSDNTLFLSFEGKKKEYRFQQKKYEVFEDGKLIESGKWKVSGLLKGQIKLTPEGESKRYYFKKINKKPIIYHYNKLPGSEDAIKTLVEIEEPNKIAKKVDPKVVEKKEELKVVEKKETKKKEKKKSSKSLLKIGESINKGISTVLGGKSSKSKDTLRENNENKIQKHLLEKFRATSNVSYYFFEASLSYLQSLELLYRAYDNNTEADKISNSIDYLKNSKSSESERLRSTKSIIGTSSIKIQSNIQDASYILSEKGRGYYEQSLPFAIGAAESTISLYKSSRLALQNIGLSGGLSIDSLLYSANDLAAIITVLPEIPGFSKDMMQTVKLIFSGAREKKIRDQGKYSKALAELNLSDFDDSSTTEVSEEEPKVEEPKVEEPKVEETKVVEKKEEPKVEETKVVEKKEEPKVEETKVVEETEEPKVEETKVVEKNNLKTKEDLEAFMIGNEIKLDGVISGKKYTWVTKYDFDGVAYMYTQGMKHPMVWKAVNGNTWREVNKGHIEDYGWTTYVIDYDNLTYSATLEKDPFNMGNYKGKILSPKVFAKKEVKKKKVATVISDSNIVQILSLNCAAGLPVVWNDDKTEFKVNPINLMATFEIDFDGGHIYTTLAESMNPKGNKRFKSKDKILSYDEEKITAIGGPYLTDKNIGEYEIEYNFYYTMSTKLVSEDTAGFGQLMSGVVEGKKYNIQYQCYPETYLADQSNIDKTLETYPNSDGYPKPYEHKKGIAAFSEEFEKETAQRNAEMAKKMAEINKQISNEYKTAMASINLKKNKYGSTQLEQTKNIVASVSKEDFKKYNVTSLISYFFFDSLSNYLESLEYLYRAYDKNTDADKLKAQITYLKSSKASENERLKSTKQIINNASSEIQSNINDDSKDLSGEAKVYYQKSLPFAFKATESGYQLFVVSKGLAKEIKGSGNLLVSLLKNANELKGAATVIPLIPDYVKNIGKTAKLIFTGAKTKKIKDDKNLGDALDELDLSA